MADEEQVRCPYDANHVMLRKSYQKHITKCSKNHPTANKKRCPFNAAHMVEELEYEYHLSICESSADFRRHTHTMEQTTLPGVIDVTEMNNIELPPKTEHWNDDPTPITYDPMKETENKLVLRPTTGGYNKSERKRYKQQEKQRFITLSNNAPISKPQQTREVKNSNNKGMKLRLPQHPPKALLSDKTNMCNTTATDNIKPKASDNENRNSNESAANTTNYNNEEEKSILNSIDLLMWLSNVRIDNNSAQKGKQLIDKNSYSDTLKPTMTSNDLINIIDEGVNSNNATNSHTDTADKINARITLLSKLEEGIKKEKAKLHEELNNMKQNNQSTNPFRTKNVGMPRCSVGRGSLLLKDKMCKKPEFNQTKQDGITYAQSLKQTKMEEDEKSNKNQVNISQHTDTFYGYGESEDDIDDEIEKYLL